MTLAMEFEMFDARTERLLVHALAAFLDITPECVKICSIEKGSVKLVVELPASAAERLLRAGDRGGLELADYLDSLGVIKLNDRFEASPPSAGMTCKEVSGIIFLFFDNEMEESLLIPFRDHVAQCGDCARKVDYTRRLLLAVRERCGHYEAPDRLVDRMLTKLPKTVGIREV